MSGDPSLVDARAGEAGASAMMRPMNSSPVETWLTDMDGVLVHEDVPIPGAQEFIEALKSSGLRFLVLTNNSIFTPRDLRARLLGSGIDVPGGRRSGPRRWRPPSSSPTSARTARRTSWARPG